MDFVILRSFKKHSCMSFFSPRSTFPLYKVDIKEMSKKIRTNLLYIPPSVLFQTHIC